MHLLNLLRQYGYLNLADVRRETCGEHGPVFQITKL